MRAGAGAALDGDQADLHSLPFDHRAFGGGIALADRDSHELGEIEKKAAVARFGCARVPDLLRAHVSLRRSIATRRRGGHCMPAPRARRLKNSAQMNSRRKTPEAE